MIRYILRAALRQLQRDVARQQRKHPSAYVRMARHPNTGIREAEATYANWNGLTTAQWVALTAKERTMLRDRYFRRSGL